jgi:hypothetical protein
MSNSFKTVVQFPITPINTNYANSLHANLCSAVLNPRLSDVEQLWLEHTTEHATQYDVVCYLFETLEDANYDAAIINTAITNNVTTFIKHNGKRVLA